MPDTVLGGRWQIFYSAENGRKAIKRDTSVTPTTIDTVNALYSALQNLFDDPSQMDDQIPMKADTPDIYRLINGWFIDDESVEYLKGGSLFSDKWKDGTTENILMIGYAQTTEFNAADIGRTIRGGTTGDTGTILDFNTGRKLVWIRPDDPLAAGDEFDNGNEAYSIGLAVDGDAITKCFQDDGGVFTDLTTAANDATVNDVIFPAAEAINDAIAFGFSQKFSRLRLNVGTAGDASGVVVWEYWNGTTWTTLTVTDGTTGLETAGTNNVSLTVPSDWATTSISGSAQLYYIRVKVTTVFTTTNPAITQGWISGVGAGSFGSHGRMGVASKAGESAWAGITTIGTIQSNTHIYAAQEDPDLESAEVNVVAMKGTSDWWGDGHLNILLKVKEADSVIGKLPNSSPATAVVTVFARQYSKTYSHFIATGLATAGGNTVVPLSTDDDGDNTTGSRRINWDGGSAATLVANEILRVGTVDRAVVTAQTGDSGATGTVDYYLIGDPLTDFTDNESVTAVTSGKTFLVNGAPSNVGPAADTDITFAHGQFTRDIDENGTADPYSINLSNASTKTMQKAYERSKFLTRRGETATDSTDGQQGQFYIGNELRVEYTSQAGGNFAEGRKVYDQGTDAEGVIVADHDDGTTGDVILRAVRGTFTNTNVLSDSPDPTYAMNTNSFIFQVDASPLAIVNESADALSAGVGDVELFPTTEAIGDYVAIGATKPFAKVVFVNTGGTAGIGGIGAWEYWNGTAWADLETAPNFSDGTADFTAAVGTQNLVFYPPVDWQSRGLSDGTVNSSTLFFIRFRVTTVYSTNPLYDTVAVEDNVTATINGVPVTIPTVAAAPFGTFPGASKFFMATGLAPTAAQMATGESQKFSTIDDNGTTRTPPNKQDVEVTNLLSGDTVAVYRRTGSAITKGQHTTSGTNAISQTTLIVNATIGADNPASGKVRVVSPSGAEHRYRYASFSAATFTLAAGVVGGTATAGSTATQLVASAGTPFANAEVGDYVRNITEGKIVRITNVVNSTTVDTEAVASWSGDTFDYQVLMETYAVGRNVFVPMIEKVTAATSEKATMTYSADIDIRVDVRRTAATAILPFTQDSSFIATGRSIAAVRSADSIIT